MRSLGRRAALLAIGVATLLIGSTPPRFPAPPTDPNQVVLQLHLWRSMTGPAERAELPEFSLYGGGRVILGAGWDGSLHRSREYTLDPQTYRAIYHLAHAAGLTRARHLPEPIQTTDGTLLVAELWSGGRLHTTTAVSLGRSAETGARLRLSELRREIQDFAVRADPAATAEYRPERVAVLATGGYSSGQDRPAPPWPLGDPAAGTRTVIGQCTVHSGAEATAILELGRETSQDTRWLNQRTGRHDLSVLVRPLLPEETGCADLEYPRA